MIKNQLLAVPPRKATFLPKNFLHKCNQPNLKKITLSFIYTKGKSFSVADMLSRSFFQEELQLNHGKHKQLPPQVLFATLTHADQIKFKPVHYLVKHETVIPSLKDDCHPGLAHFGNDQFPLREDEEGEEKVFKYWIPSRLMLYSQSKFNLKTNHEFC